MEIGIGLPNTLAHPGPLMIEWARLARGAGIHLAPAVPDLAEVDRLADAVFWRRGDRRPAVSRPGGVRATGVM